MVSWLRWTTCFFSTCPWTYFAIFTLQFTLTFRTLHLRAIVLFYHRKYFFRQNNVGQSPSSNKFCTKFSNLPSGLFYFKKHSSFTFYIFGTRKLIIKKSENYSSDFLFVVRGFWCSSPSFNSPRRILFLSESLSSFGKETG